ncbi:hypothetical protein [Saprospira grandis]|uniref:Lipoprotein n=1 Tax=Saprospira grandis (strain Lewin) TaxID=984262 RepID=H6L2E7_SAPGL|nr:hypothetical protein [Saprospira grandis]AFC23605.1 hypothetical protein SGRA_0869 [Saprospira grandis str. Lewin]
MKKKLVPYLVLLLLSLVCSCSPLKEDFRAQSVFCQNLQLEDSLLSTLQESMLYMPRDSNLIVVVFFSDKLTKLANENIEGGLQLDYVRDSLSGQYYFEKEQSRLYLVKEYPAASTLILNDSLYEAVQELGETIIQNAALVGLSSFWRDQKDGNMKLYIEYPIRFFLLKEGGPYNKEKCIVLDENWCYCDDRVKNEKELLKYKKVYLKNKRKE